MYNRLSVRPIDPIEQQSMKTLAGKDQRRERAMAQLKLKFGNRKERKYFDSADYYREVWFNLKQHKPENNAESDEESEDVTKN